MEAEAASGLLNEIWSGAVHPLALSLFFVWLSVTLINPVFRKLESKLRRRTVDFHVNGIEKFLFRAVPIVIGIDLIALFFGTVDSDSLWAGLALVAAPVLFVTVLVYVVYPFLVLALVFLSELMKEFYILLFIRKTGEQPLTKNNLPPITLPPVLAIALACLILILPMDLIWHDLIWQTGNPTPLSEASEISAPPDEVVILFFGMPKNQALRLAELFLIIIIQAGFVFRVANPLLLNQERSLPFPALGPKQKRISFWLVAFIYIPAILILVVADEFL